MSPLPAVVQTVAKESPTPNVAPRISDTQRGGRGSAQWIWLLFALLLVAFVFAMGLRTPKGEDDWRLRAAKSQLKDEILAEQLGVLKTAEMLGRHFQAGEGATNGFTTAVATAMYPESSTLQGQLAEIRAIHARLKRQLKFRQETDPSR